MSRLKFVLSTVALLAALPTHAASQAADTATLDAVSGKVVCRTVGTLDGKPGELCVAQGMFAHDIYEVRFGGTSAAKGTDDATTTGISGTFNGQTVTLKCEPVLSVPDNLTDAQIEGFRFMNPTASREELKQMAIRVNTVETGRHCVARANAVDIFTVDVKFQ